MPLKWAPKLLFENPTIAALAEQVQRLQAAGPGQAQQPLVPIERSDRLRLSYSQQRLWFLEQLQGPSATYNIPSAQRLSGPIDMAAWRSSVEALVQLQESLRTTFTSIDGAAVAVVNDKIDDIVTVVNLADLSPAYREERIDQLIKRDARQPFDLVEGPLIRMKLLQLGDDEHILLLNMHHIISDGWSVGVLIKQLLALYQARLAGESMQLEPLPVQYVDYADWQREWLDNGVGQQQLQFWQQQLQDLVPLLALPTDRPRPLNQTFEGDLVNYKLSGPLSEQLRTFANARGVTLYMVFLSAYQIVLSRYAGQSDVAVGSITASRTRQEVQDLIGCFVNSIVLRSTLQPDMAYEDFLAGVKQMTRDAYANQDVPFEQLVDSIQPQRALDQSPLFQVALVQNTPAPEIAVADMKVTALSAGSKTSRFDMTLYITDAVEQISLTMEYNTDLFDAATMTRLLGHLEQLLQSLLAQPRQSLYQLPMLADTERQQLLEQWSVLKGDRLDFVRQRLGDSVDPQQAGVRHLYLLDEWLNPAAQGIVGELYIDGELDGCGLASVANPFGEGELYRLGELARYCDAGILEFLGRVDRRVAIRGYRVHLDRVVEAIEQYQGVSEAFVTVVDSEDERQLAGYFVADQAQLPVGELFNHLKKPVAGAPSPSRPVAAGKPASW